MTVRLLPAGGVGPRGELGEHADRLRSRVATSRLVALLLGCDGDAVDAGRYRFLARAMGRRPALARALLRDDRPASWAEWKALAATCADDPEFVRGLAIMRLEQAQGAADAEIAAATWTAATALWSCVACAAEPRAGDDAALDRAIDAILDLHRRLGGGHLAAGRSGPAGVHARCLRLCAGGQPAIRSALEREDPVLLPSLDDARCGALAARAERLLEDWGRAIAGEAEAAADDPDALERCDRGMRRDYAAGLARLEPFIALEVGVAGPLVTALELCNSWADDLLVAERSSDLEALLERAQPAARRLAEVSANGSGSPLAKSELAKHHVHRAVSNADVAAALEEIGVALRWDPGSHAAAIVRRNRLSQLLVGHVEHERWTEAEALIHELLASPFSQEEQAELRRALSVVLNGRGAQLVEASRRATSTNPEPALREAERLLAEAVSLDPGNGAISKNLAVVREELRARERYQGRRG